MKKIQAPNAHQAGVSHIYFAEVLAFFSTPRKRKNLRKKNPFCLPILDTKDIGQCLGVKDHPTKMGSNLVVIWLFVLTTRQLGFLTSIHTRLIKIHLLGFGLQISFFQDQILSLNKSTEGELVAHSSPRTEIGENPSNPFRFKHFGYLVSQFTCHELASGHSILYTLRQAFLVRPPTHIARGPLYKPALIITFSNAMQLDIIIETLGSTGLSSQGIMLYSHSITLHKSLQ